MTNNKCKRVDVQCTVNAKIIIPKCPRSVMLEGGGQIETKALDDETLNKIADLWREEFISKARETAQKDS